MSTPNLFPNARRTQVVVEPVKDEILIYDQERDQASCLNSTASLVWKYADGKTSVSEIAKKMSDDLGSTVDARVVWYALDQLDKKHLLEQPIKTPAQYSRLTRRDFLTRAGIVGAAVVIPVIISLAAPTPAMAASCTVPCTINANCAGQVAPCTTICNTVAGVCNG